MEIKYIKNKELSVNRKVLYFYLFFIFLFIGQLLEQVPQLHMPFDKTFIFLYIISSAIRSIPIDIIISIKHLFYIIKFPILNTKKEITHANTN